MSKFVFKSVTVPGVTEELSSIPPPALFAELFEILESLTVKEPPSTFWIPPPEPAVPVAALLDIVEEF